MWRRFTLSRVRALELESCSAALRRIDSGAGVPYGTTSRAVTELTKEGMSVIDIAGVMGKDLGPAALYSYRRVGLLPSEVLDIRRLTEATGKLGKAGAKGFQWALSLVSHPKAQIEHPATGKKVWDKTFCIAYVTAKRDNAPLPGAAPAASGEGGSGADAGPGDGEKAKWKMKAAEVRDRLDRIQDVSPDAATVLRIAMGIWTLEDVPEMERDVARAILNLSDPIEPTIHG